MVSYIKAETQANNNSELKLMSIEIDVFTRSEKFSTKMNSRRERINIKNSVFTYYKMVQKYSRKLGEQIPAPKQRGGGVKDPYSHAR